MIMTNKDKVKALKDILMEDIEMMNGNKKETEQKEEVKAVLKYNVGDRVTYYDKDRTKRVGNIEAIELTDVYEWNKDKEREYIYTLSSTDYLRSEEDIIGLCK